MRKQKNETSWMMDKLLQLTINCWCNWLTRRSGLNNISCDRCTALITTCPMQCQGSAIARNKRFSRWARGSLWRHKWWIFKRKSKTFLWILTVEEKGVVHNSCRVSHLLRVQWWCWPPPQGHTWVFWPGCESYKWHRQPGPWSSSTGERCLSHLLLLSYWHLECEERSLYRKH